MNLLTSKILSIFVSVHQQRSKVKNRHLIQNSLNLSYFQKVYKTAIIAIVSIKQTVPSATSVRGYFEKFCKRAQFFSNFRRISI